MPSFFSHPNCSSRPSWVLMSVSSIWLRFGVAFLNLFDSPPILEPLLLWANVADLLLGARVSLCLCFPVLVAEPNREGCCQWQGTFFLRCLFCSCSIPFSISLNPTLHGCCQFCDGISLELCLNTASPFVSKLLASPGPCSFFGTSPPSNCFKSPFPFSFPVFLHFVSFVICTPPKP